MSSPEWYNIALIMQDMSRKLPADWDHTPDFWLGAVQNLAEVVVAMEGKLPVEQIGTLVGAGGLMIAQTVKQSEAADLTSALFSRIKGGRDD